MIAKFVETGDIDMAMFFTLALKTDIGDRTGLAGRQRIGNFIVKFFIFIKINNMPEISNIFYVKSLYIFSENLVSFQDLSLFRDDGNTDRRFSKKPVNINIFRTNVLCQDYRLTGTP